MIHVIDASAIGALILPGEDPALAQAARNVMGNAVMIAPMHMPIETASLIRKAVRQERIAEFKGASAAAAGILAGVELERGLPLDDVLGFALDHGLSVYDAAYLELAYRRSAILITGDHALRRAASSLSVMLAFGA